MPLGTKCARNQDGGGEGGVCLFSLGPKKEDGRMQKGEEREGAAIISHARIHI